MDLSGIISISGKPGIFKVVAQSKNNIIVESLIDGKRFPAYSTDRISALEDISIYTYEEDVPLKDVYIKIAEKEECGTCISHKESKKKLISYLEEVFPDYDEDRVYPSDIKKLIQWYNILHKADLISLEEEKEEKEEETKEEKPKAEKLKEDKPKEVKPKAKKTEKAKATPKKKAKTSKATENKEK